MREPLRVLGLAGLALGAACGGDDGATVDAAAVDAAVADAAIDAPTDAPTDAARVGPCYTTDPGPFMLPPPPMNVFAAPSIDLSSTRTDSIFQAEGHIAVSPTTGAALAAYIAVSGGSRSFIGTSHVPASGTGAVVQGAIPTPVANTIGTDPSVAYSSDGVAHVALMTLTINVSGAASNFHVSTTASTDDGATWAGLVDVMGTDCAGACDKPWIAAGRHPTNPAGRSLYVTYAAAATPTSAFAEHIVRSDDGGATWTAPVTIDAPAGGANIGMPVVASDGRLHVVWARESASGAEVYWATSTDGGATFTTPRRIDRAADGVEAEQQIVVVVTAAAIHVAYVGGPAEGVWDVTLATSTDSGATWSYRKVNDEPDTCATHAWLAGAATSTGVALSWIDNRYGTGENVFDVCPDNAASPCGTDQRVSDVPYAFTRARNTTQWLGDYGGLAVSGSTIWGTWTDARASVSTQRAARGTLP